MNAIEKIHELVQNTLKENHICMVEKMAQLNDIMQLSLYMSSVVCGKVAGIDARYIDRLITTNTG